ncbi:MAG: glycerol-3-phosphate acyltransferase [bacterium]
MAVIDIVLPIIGYLLGSIPSGVLLGRLVGRDPRAGGSGNIGASNVTRTLGRKLGAATLALDLLKGLLPVLVARSLAGVERVAAAVGLAWPSSGTATPCGCASAVARGWRPASASSSRSPPSSR